MAKRAAVLLIALLSACTTSGGLAGGHIGAPSNVQSQSGDSQRRNEDIGIYLQTLRDLIEGDSVVQADAFRRAADAASAAPTTTNRLRLALALATPGHPSSNPAEAQKQLSQILASGDTLLPEERILALVHLKEVEQRLILDAEAQRLQRAAQAATTQRNDQSAQRLQTALDENRQLRQALDEARAKLDDIINTERSIRERENGSNPR